MSWPFRENYSNPPFPLVLLSRFQLPTLNCRMKTLIFVLTLSREKKHIQLTSITVYCQNCYILVLVIVTGLLLYLVEEQKFITGVYVQEDMWQLWGSIPSAISGIHRHSLWIRGGTIVLSHLPSLPKQDCFFPKKWATRTTGICNIFMFNIGCLTGPTLSFFYLLHS